MDATEMTARRRGERHSWFFAGMAVALATTVWFAAEHGAALPDQDESTFVPIVPCRLLDTRPDEAFNVGPRTTPLGPGESHQLAITGADECVIPDGATAVSLNVTAVDATAPTYLTLYPFDAEPPTASNLNVVPGAAPTPNKVDVRLSPAGEVGVFNAFGTVHVIVDVSGYYTADGLRDLADGLGQLAANLAGKANAGDHYTKPEVDAALAGKADSDDHYTKPEIDAALAGKADSDDHYTRDEIDARTQQRSIAFSPSDLALPDAGTAFSFVNGELWWEPDTNDMARLRLARPADWTADSPVTVRIHFTRTQNDGNVRIRAYPSSHDPGMPNNGVAPATEFPPQSEAALNVAFEVGAEIEADLLQGAWWTFDFHRPNVIAGDVGEPIFVHAVEIRYEAST